MNHYTSVVFDLIYQKSYFRLHQFPYCAINDRFEKCSAQKNCQIAGYMNKKRENSSVLSARQSQLISNALRMPCPCPAPALHLPCTCPAPLDENLFANLDRHLGKVQLQYLKHKVNLDVEGSAKK